MHDPRESVSIGDDGTLDTVVHYDGRFGERSADTIANIASRLRTTMSFWMQ